MSENRFNFTKARLDDLKLPDAGKRDTYHDTRIPGLILRVTSTGARSFAVYRRVQGKVGRITLGPYPELTIEQARKKAEEINGAIALGDNPNQAKKKGKAELTFSEVFTNYLDLHAKPHKRSWDEDEAQYKRYLTRWRTPTRC